jgi:transposase InsO family protein
LLLELWRVLRRHVDHPFLSPDTISGNRYVNESGANSAGIIRSMSRKGCSPDNSRMEGFFGTMKNEMFYGRDWEGVSLEELGKRIDDYIEWYNTKRIRRSLGSMSPLAYRQNLVLAA